MRWWPVWGLLCGLSVAHGGEDQLVSAGWLAERLTDPNLVIVHLAPSREVYDEAHLPGARCLLRSAVAVTRDGLPAELPPVEQLVGTFTALGIGDTARVIVYDNEGRDWPARCFFALDYLGQADRVALLDGGLPAWLHAKLPVTREVGSYSPAPFTPRWRPEALVRLGQAVEASWLCQQPNPAVCLLDTRSTAEFTGETPGTDVARGGHIPGAASLPLSEIYAGSEAPTLKPVAELRHLFATAGVRPDRPVVVYCRTGLRSAPVYFAAKLLGYDARLYDGSFGEWSRQPELPVATGP